MLEHFTICIMPSYNATVNTEAKRLEMHTSQNNNLTCSSIPTFNEFGQKSTYI